MPGDCAIMGTTIAFDPKNGDGMSMEDKRTHRRKTLHAEALIADVLGNTWSKVELLDISESGAAFLSSEEFTAGASRMLRFHLPGHDERLSALCRIVHCTPHSYLGGFRVGTAFVRMDEQGAKAVAGFVGAGSASGP